MRKFQVVEVAFNMDTRATTARVVATGLDADKAFTKARSLNEAVSDGNIAKGYKVEVATA